MQSRIIAIIAGVLTITIGLVLSGVVVNTVTDSGQKQGAAIKVVASAGTGLYKAGQPCPSGAKCYAPGSPGTQKTTLAENDLVSFNRLGSFSGASSVMNLIPLIYYTAIVVLGVGMIGIGGSGFAGYGPLRNG